MLSRGGFELNEIWEQQCRALTESDEERRARERRARAEFSDPAAQEPHHHDLLRLGKHEKLVDAGGGHLLSGAQQTALMRPHIANYEKTGEARLSTLRQYTWDHPKHDEKNDPAIAKLDKARETAQAKARGMGRTAGEFLEPREGDTHSDHQYDMARLHNGPSKSWEQDDSGATAKIHFFSNARDHDEFARAVKAKYGDTYEVTKRSVKEHGPYKHQEPGETHRVHIRRRSGGPNFATVHGGDSGGELRVS